METYCEICLYKAIPPIPLPDNVVVVIQDGAARVNCAQHSGTTFLHAAAIEYDVNKFNNFIRAQPNINLNAVDQYLMAPIHSAIKYRKDNNFALRLVNMGCDIHKRDSLERTPLMYAVKFGQPELAHELIQNGADVNAQDVDGNSVLHHTWQHPNPRILDVLLFHDADPMIRNSKNETCFMFLLKNQLPDCWQEYLQECIMDFEVNMNHINTDGSSTLFLALWYETDWLEEIIDRGADVNYVYEDVSALHLAILSSEKDAFDLINPRFDYNRVYGGYYRMPLLRSFFHNYKCSDFLHRVQRFYESKNFAPAMIHYCSLRDMQYPIVSEIIKSFSRRDCPAKDLSFWVCSAVSYGAGVRYSDIEMIYLYYGATADGIQTVEFLLHTTDIKLIRPVSTVSVLSHPHIVLNVSRDVSLCFNEFRFSSNLRVLAEQLMFLPTLFRYCKPTVAFIDELKITHSKLLDQDTDFAAELARICRLIIVSSEVYGFIPKLVELCRNAVRKRICTNRVYFYTNYRSLLNTLRLRQVDRNAALFLKQFYDDEINLPEIDMNYFESYSRKKTSVFIPNYEVTMG